MAEYDKEQDIILTPDSNTIKTPEEFALDLARSGTDNYLNLNQTWAGEMPQLLGDGVPGPEGEELTGTDNQIEQEIEAGEENYQSPCSITPRPE